MSEQTPPNCPYCQRQAECVTGGFVYPHRADLAHRCFWRCPGDCEAWVGCHPGTDKPLGRLANAELRIAKRRAHSAFDPFWQTTGSKNKKNRQRSQAYTRLAIALGIAPEGCHIGMFDVELCRRTVEICEGWSTQ